MGIWKVETGRYAGLWTYKFQYQGRQHKRVNFRTKRDALAAEAALRRELARPETPSPTVTAFSGICESYLDFCQGRFTQNTIRQKIFVFKSMIGFIGSDVPCDALDIRMVETYLSDQLQGRGPKAANRDLRDIKALFNWAGKRGLCAVTGISLIEPYPEGKTIKYIPPVEDFNRVLMVAHGDDRDLLL